MKRNVLALLFGLAFTALLGIEQPETARACEDLGLGTPTDWWLCAGCQSSSGTTCDCTQSTDPRTCLHVPHKTCINAYRSYNALGSTCNVIRCEQFCYWLSTCSLVGQPGQTGPCFSDDDCAIDPWGAEGGSETVYYCLT
jgi:hypothetical protein